MSRLTIGSLLLISLFFSACRSGGQAVSTDATLSNLIVSFSGSDLELIPVFSSGTLNYEVSMPSGTSVTVTATANQADATLQVRINGGTYADITSGTVSSALATQPGENTLDVQVTAQNGDIQTYSVTIYDFYAYVTNSNANNLAICNLDMNRQITTCQTSVNILSDPDGVAFDPQRNYIYLPNFGGTTVTVCTTQDDGSVTDCTDAATGFDGPTNVAITPDGNQAYVSSYTNGILFHCSVNTNGTFSNCTNSGVALTNPFGLNINQAGTLLYITDWGTSLISTCAIANDGSLANCQATGASATYSSPGAVTLTPSEDYAYIANYDNGNGNAVIVCDVETDGSLTHCTQALASLNAPIGVAIDPLGLYAYITNYGDNTVLTCTIGNDGTLSACSTSSGFTGPAAIIIQ